MSLLILAGKPLVEAGNCRGCTRVHSSSSPYPCLAQSRTNALVPKKLEELSEFDEERQLATTESELGSRKYDLCRSQPPFVVETEAHG